jgi:hypothetical protein
MAQPQKEPLRALNEQEERELQRVAKATSERLDVVRRAKALVAVANGKPFTQAAHEAGLKSGDGVGKLVKRFNVGGLAALSIAAGAGRKPTYTSEQRARIVAEVQREPDRKEDQTATWSLMTALAGPPRDRLARHRGGDDSRGAARGRLQVSTHTHLGSHGVRAAGAQERHCDDL